MSKKYKKKVIRACGAYEMERFARAIHKLMVVAHVFVPSVGLLEAKNAPGASQSEIFNLHMEGKRVEAGGQKSDRSQQSEVDVFFFFLQEGATCCVLRQDAMA